MDLRQATSATIVELVMNASNDIHDPCGLAQGASIGMADMGLIRAVEATRTDRGRWHVKVTIRFTSPGCFYFGYFERRLAEVLEPYPELDLAVEWDDRLDWTPADLALSARQKLAAVRRQISPIEKGSLQDTTAEGGGT
jgi:metal-sulfur cluster biosynthetic enzyme